MHKNNTNIYSPTFTSRIKINHVLHNTKQKFNSTFSHMASPTLIKNQPTQNPYIHYGSQIYLSLCQQLDFIRNYLSKSISNKNPLEYYTWLLRLIKQYQVANCHECAEITNIILRLNKVNNSDIFHLYAKSKDGKIRFLDHTVTAIGVKKKQNNKNNPQLFKPNKNVKILDMWFDCPKGFSSKIKNLKAKLKELFKIKEDEEILFKPVPSLELNKETLNMLRKEFPNLIFKSFTK